MKVKVMWMNGGRVDDYYYVGIEGTDLIACEDGHPDFAEKFSESEKKSEQEAKKLASRVNKQLKRVKN